MDLIAVNIDVPNRTALYYKRVIWAGVRNSMPSLIEKVYIGSDDTFEDRILQKEKLSEKQVPTLVVWENALGDKSYAEINRGAN